MNIISHFKKSKINRFIIVGIVSVLIDFIVYYILLTLNYNISFAKSIGFISGAFFSYQFNRKWTFNIKTINSMQIITFIFVYLSGLGLNVLSNNFIFFLVNPIHSLAIYISFLLSTSISASYNYIGMKMLVFRK